MLWLLRLQWAVRLQCDRPRPPAAPAPPAPPHLATICIWRRPAGAPAGLRDFLVGGPGGAPGGLGSRQRAACSRGRGEGAEGWFVVSACEGPASTGACLGLVLVAASWPLPNPPMPTHPSPAAGQAAAAQPVAGAAEGAAALGGNRDGCPQAPAQRSGQAAGVAAAGGWRQRRWPVRGRLVSRRQLAGRRRAVRACLGLVATLYITADELNASDLPHSGRHTATSYDNRLWRACSGSEHGKLGHNEINLVE